MRGVPGGLARRSRRTRDGLIARGRATPLRQTQVSPQHCGFFPSFSGEPPLASFESSYQNGTRRAGCTWRNRYPGGRFTPGEPIRSPRKNLRRLRASADTWEALNLSKSSSYSCIKFHIGFGIVVRSIDDRRTCPASFGLATAESSRSCRACDSVGAQRAGSRAGRASGGTRQASCCGIA